jgi:hypothetical protein
MLSHVARPNPVDVVMGPTWAVVVIARCGVFGMVVP